MADEREEVDDAKASAVKLVADLSTVKNRLDMNTNRFKNLTIQLKEKENKLVVARDQAQTMKRSQEQQEAEIDRTFSSCEVAPESLDKAANDEISLENGSIVPGFRTVIDNAKKKLQEGRTLFDGFDSTYTDIEIEVMTIKSTAYNSTHVQDVLQNIRILQSKAEPCARDTSFSLATVKEASAKAQNHAATLSNQTESMSSMEQTVRDLFAGAESYDTAQQARDQSVKRTAKAKTALADNLRMADKICQQLSEIDGQTQKLMVNVSTLLTNLMANETKFRLEHQT
jgi:hypothetical protein